MHLTSDLELVNNVSISAFSTFRHADVMPSGVGDCNAGSSATPLGPERGPVKDAERPLTDKLGVVMSKIPQGEWSAIAARYAKGESITRIAQSYGCTPPAIHYILKRSTQRATHNAEQRLNVRRIGQ